MTANGNGGSDPADVYRRHFGSVEHYRREAEEAGQMADKLRAEAEQLLAQAESWEGKRSGYEARAARAGAAEGGLCRSKMSALAKSQYMTQYGVAAYEALPWGDGRERKEEARSRWSPNWR